jgi:hypothetical protein
VSSCRPVEVRDYGRPAADSGLVIESSVGVNFGAVGHEAKLPQAGRSRKCEVSSRRKSFS